MPRAAPLALPSGRLAPERVHKEVMQRARAFRIFEIQVALARNQQLLSDAQAALSFIDEGIAQLEPMVEALQPKRSPSRRGSSRPRTGGAAALLASRPTTTTTGATTTPTMAATVPEEAATDDGNLIPWPPVSPSSLKETAIPPPVSSQAPAPPPTLKQQLIGARRAVMKRVAYAEEEFGAASKGDLSELRAIDKELLLIAKAPKDPSEVAATPPYEALLARLEAARPQADALRVEVEDLEAREGYLKRLFERAYEEDDPEATFVAQSREKELKNTNVKSSNSVSSLGSSSSSSDDSEQRRAAVASMERVRAKGVPCLTERESSRFFLLAHLLDYLVSQEQFDLHMKCFYDLTGSSGQVVVAACYCLPGGGKLNGELGSWAAPTADDSNLGSEGEGGKSSASLSSFERFKLAREAKHAASESAALAEQERLEKREEEADAAAEAAAVAAGKITTADLEVPPPVWPFDQHYKSDADYAAETKEASRNNTAGGGKEEKKTPSTNLGGDAVFAAKALASKIGGGMRSVDARALAQEVYFVEAKPPSMLAAMANEAHEAIALRAAKREARTQEMLLRGQKFRYATSEDPRWDRVVGFEGGERAYEDAQDLLHVGLPKRKLERAGTPADEWGFLGTSSPSSPSSSAFSPHSSPSKGHVAHSASFHQDSNAPRSPGARGKSRGAESARLLQRQRSSIEVRPKDFLSAGNAWEDADVVFFDTSFGLSSGVDEGALVMALEPGLLKLQPGSYAIIVTRCLRRIIDQFAPCLELVTSTTRCLQSGEEVSAWLMKVVQAPKGRI